MPSRYLLNLARKRRWSCFKENVLNQSNKRESEPGGHCVSVWLPRLSQTILTGGGEHPQRRCRGGVCIPWLLELSVSADVFLLSWLCAACTGLCKAEDPALSLWAWVSWSTSFSPTTSLRVCTRVRACVD